MGASTIARSKTEDGPVCMLVVEDEPEVSSAIARHLEAEGMLVEIASEARGIVGRLEAGDDWDVVLLDVSSGIELLHRFRETGALASVIMLSSDDGADTAARCMRAGAFHYLTKPFRAVELVACVPSAARYSRMRRQLVGEPPADDGELLPLTEAKRKASAAFERRYLVRVMKMAHGSVSEAARLAGLDRTNFRRLLQRHGLHPAGFK